MKREKLSLEAAFSRIHALRPVFRPNLNFLRQLAQFEEELSSEVGGRGEWVGVVGDGEEGLPAPTRRIPRFIAENPSLLKQYRF